MPGAIVFADDGLSESVVADDKGDFIISNVATGTWTVFASTGTFAGRVGGVVINGGPPTTIPAIIATNVATGGYISGIVTKINARVSRERIRIVTFIRIMFWLGWFCFLFRSYFRSSRLVARTERFRDDNNRRYVFAGDRA